MDFFESLIQNFTEHFNKTYNQPSYPNQNHVSCKFLYDLCVETDPDFVLDIGTNFGASTLSLAYGLKSLNRKVNRLTTIDISHQHWNNTTPVIQKELLLQHEINIEGIKTICNDFKSIDPKTVISDDSRYFVFYDIHDTATYSFSAKFFNEWVPLLQNPVLVFHDVSVTSDSYVVTQIDPNYPRVTARHFSGQNYSGFKECSEIIKWANERKLEINAVPQTSIVWIKS